MNIYILTAREDLAADIDNPWHPWYDKNFGSVVVAESEIGARTLAAKECEAEGPEAWLNPQYSTCEVLKAEGKARVILSDFRSA